MIRAISAALLLTLSAPLAAADAPPPATAAEAPVMVVIFERLTNEPPQGLPMLSAAAKQLENEFKPRSAELNMLSQQYDIALRAVQQAEQAGRKDQAAIDRANQLGLDLQRKSDDAAAAYQSRQAVVIDPLVQQVDAALQRFQGDGEVFLIGEQEFYAQPPGTVIDVTAAFVSWMGTQP